MPQSPNPQIVKRVKNLCEIAKALRRGKHFPMTRLTTIKSLCAEPEAGTAFAFFLTQRIQRKMRRGKHPKKFRELVDRAVKELKPDLAEPTDERRARLSSLCTEMQAEQNDYKKIGWNMVRLLKSREMSVVERPSRFLRRKGFRLPWSWLRFGPRQNNQDGRVSDDPGRVAP